jgi:hypothetical protein
MKGADTFNKLVGQFEDKFNALDAAAQRYGVTMDDLQGKKPADLLGARADTMIKDFNLLTAKMGEENTLRKMAPAFNDLVKAALDAGQKLPAAMQPALQQMLNFGLMTDDVKRRLLGLTDGTVVDFEAMQEKAQQYGIDLASLGGKFQQARLGETAQSIMADFKMLTDAGADVGGVLFGMKEEISDLVSQSLKFGTEIPENMRPLIENLRDSGLLLDENGNKIEDLSKLKFAEPLEAGFDRVVTAIRELTGVLTHDLPDAVEDGVNQADNALKNWKPDPVPISFEYEGQPPWSENYTPPYGAGVPPRAAKGVMAGGRGGGDLVLFGEAGEPEVGGPADFFEGVFRRLGIGPGQQATSGGITLRIPVMLDRRQMGEAIYELTPEVLRQRGLLK